MRVISNLQELGEPVTPSVVTIGNFDGVHLAHQTLLRRVVEVARPQGSQATAITFEPHPIKILSPDHAPKLLTPLQAQSGVDRSHGNRLAGGPALYPRTGPPIALGVRAPRTGRPAARVVRAGWTQLSLRLSPVRATRKSWRNSGSRKVSAWRLCPCSYVRGDRVSSTRIRELLTEGQVHKANRLLGRPFSVPRTHRRRHGSGPQAYRAHAQSGSH